MLSGMGHPTLPRCRVGGCSRSLGRSKKPPLQVPHHLVGVTHASNSHVTTLLMRAGTGPHPPVHSASSVPGPGSHQQANIQPKGNFTSNGGHNIVVPNSRMEHDFLICISGMSQILALTWYLSPYCTLWWVFKGRSTSAIFLYRSPRAQYLKLYGDGHRLVS